MYCISRSDNSCSTVLLYYSSINHYFEILSTQHPPYFVIVLTCFGYFNHILQLLLLLVQQNGWTNSCPYPKHGRPRSFGRRRPGASTLDPPLCHLRSANREFFCDGQEFEEGVRIHGPPCLGADRVPTEAWGNGQRTPFCTRCEPVFRKCRFCLGVFGPTPPAWGPGPQ